MKLGVHVGYWGLGMGAEDQLAVVQEAERLGYDSVWSAEAYGSDAATVLAWLAAQTSQIRLGSAIFQMPGRSPAMTAMTAATLDQLSGRPDAAGHRLIRAPGGRGMARSGGSPGSSSAPASMWRWSGTALARERVEFHGETIELPLPDGPGKPLKLMIAPVQERMPIYLAAIGPKNTSLAGEIADGWIPTFFSPEYVADFRALLEEGAGRAGRSLEGFDIAPTVNAYVSDDVEQARNLMRPVLGAVHRRHGLSQAELLQQPRPALRLRGSGGPDPGSVPGGQEGGGGGGDSGRADRHGLSVRAARRGARPPGCVP